LSEEGNSNLQNDIQKYAEIIQQFEEKTHTLKEVTSKLQSEELKSKSLLSQFLAKEEETKSLLEQLKDNQNKLHDELLKNGSLKIANTKLQESLEEKDNILAKFTEHLQKELDKQKEKLESKRLADVALKEEQMRLLKVEKKSLEDKIKVLEKSDNRKEFTTSGHNTLRVEAEVSKAVSWLGSC